MAHRRVSTAAVATAGLLPLAALLGRATIGDAFGGDLGANPIEEVTHETGIWALRFLVATLAVTPLRRWTGRSVLASQRRTLGLLAFAYATLHLATYALLDVGLDVEAIREDLGERTYIALGFATWCLLLPLALTSTRGAIRRLGRRWILLHRLVYVCAIGAVAHYTWLVKKDMGPPLAYGAAVAALLAARIVAARAGARGARPGAAETRSA